MPQERPKKMAKRPKKKKNPLKSLPPRKLKTLVCTPLSSCCFRTSFCRALSLAFSYANLFDAELSSGCICRAPHTLQVILEPSQRRKLWATNMQFWLSSDLQSGVRRMPYRGMCASELCTSEATTKIYRLHLALKQKPLSTDQ